MDEHKQHASTHGAEHNSDQRAHEDHAGHDARHGTHVSDGGHEQMFRQRFVVALPLAAGVLAPIGVLLSPAVGALLMSLSTIIVAANAQTLRRAQLTV